MLVYVSRQQSKMEHWKIDVFVQWPAFSTITKSDLCVCVCVNHAEEGMNASWLSSEKQAAPSFLHSSWRWMLFIGHWLSAYICASSVYTCMQHGCLNKTHTPPSFVETFFCFLIFCLFFSHKTQHSMPFLCKNYPTFFTNQIFIVRKMLSLTKKIVFFPIVLKAFFGTQILFFFFVLFPYILLADIVCFSVHTHTHTKSCFVQQIWRLHPKRLLLYL